MPGLSQLKKLSEDVLRLGNEPKLRAERGEKPVTAVIPPSVPDVDDSEDFVLGMPEKPQDEPDPAAEAQAQAEQEALQSAANDLESLLSGNSTPAPGEPDLSSLLNPMADAGADVPDLSAFEEPETPPEPPAKEEPSIADMDLDSLLSMPSEDFSEPEPIEEPKPEPEIPSETVDVSFDDFSVPEMGGSDFSEPEPVADLESAGEPEPLDSDISEPEELSAEDDEFAYSGSEIDMNSDLPDELREVPGDPFAARMAKAKNDLQESSEEPEVPADTDISFDEPAPEMADDFGETAEIPSGDEPVPDEIPTSGDSGFDAIDTSGLDDFGSMGDISDAMGSTGDDPASFDLDSSMDTDFSVPESDGAAGGEEEFDPASLDLSGLNLGGDEGENADFGETQTPEVFDTSEMDGVTFNDSPADASSLSDFNIPDTDSQLNGGSDFELDSEGAGEPDFEIEGYTGVDANPFDKSGRIKTQIPEKTEERKKNTLTDAEYKRFKNNLKAYPLNVRIAVEDMIVKNEFTDDVIFEVIDKILKKVPARQLASHLEKMLDIQLSVPRDFERRTAEEYEAYKQSIQYQLKNRIIPAIIIGVFVFLIGFCSVYLGIEFVVKPLKAESLYRQGYTLLENNEYPQSEMQFNAALKLKQKKKWFFKYAEGYRKHKQYDRAEMMYKNILKRFDHDKQGGLDYVHMELDDLANYAKAEQIILREVLDYHIQDRDALLLLGDIYLEWATEEDPSKFEAAYNQYSELIQLDEAKNEYLARLMRYSVRTDKLKDVLIYKEIFYPDEKSLGSDDWTEMSGYLMDKLYGELTPQEEYLRSSIEDVYSMLIRAVKKDPSNPISRYNISRYYIESSDRERAKEELKKTLNLFENVTHLKKRDTYKLLDSFRLLGEQYVYSRDYILAQETFTEGIDFFEEKKEISGFESDKNVGVMYADMADLDYFISGDLENAERNYRNSINNKNDNASIRYRVGYIEYGNKDYESAFNNFVIAAAEKGNDKNLMLALGNTLALRDDNYAGSGYYERVIEALNREIEKKDILMPQVKEDDTALVEAYMKASNNLGVTQFRIARQSGNSALNGQSIFNLQNSLRAWDALTRNPQTMVRLGGTNLAELNIKYITHPVSLFEPAVYTDISRILENEKPLE